MQILAIGFRVLLMPVRDFVFFVAMVTIQVGGDVRTLTISDLMIHSIRFGETTVHLPILEPVLCVSITYSRIS